MKKISLKKRDSPDEITEDDIIKMMEIDKYKLDEENSYQSKLMSIVSKIYGEKHTKKYLLELEVGIIKDQLAEDMKQNPHKWGLEAGKEPSEAMVARMIIRNTRYQNKYKEYVKAKGEDKEWEGMLKAVEQKAWALKSLENLWQKGYYS
jgi:hypothetical protein